MWFIGVEVEQEMSAPPPKKNPGSALVYGKPGNSVENSKGMVHPGGNFERGWCTQIRIPNLTRLGIYLILIKLFINFF